MRSPYLLPLALLASGLCLAQSTPSPNYLSDQLVSFLKLETSQVRDANVLLAKLDRLYGTKFDRLYEIYDAEDALYSDATMDPSAIGSAMAPLIAEEVSIKRELKVELAKTHQAVVSLLSAEQRLQLAKLEEVVKLVPTAMDATDALFLDPAWEDSLYGSYSTTDTTSSRVSRAGKRPEMRKWVLGKRPSRRR